MKNQEITINKNVGKEIARKLQVRKGQVREVQVRNKNKK